MFGHPHKTVCIGEVVYLDIETQQIVARGYGQIDLTAFVLTASLTTLVPGYFKRLLVIVTTSENHIAPFATYCETLICGLMSNVSYNLRAYLYWPANQPITLPLQTFSSIHITIRAQHRSSRLHATVHPHGISEQLTQQAIATNLGSSNYRRVAVNLSAGYKVHRATTARRGAFSSQLDTYIRYRLTGLHFSFSDLGNALLAFKLYWLSYFDSTDCTVEAISLDKEVGLCLKDARLYALSIYTPDYRSVITIDQPLHIDSLAKMSYFFLNPSGKRHFGPSSKIGLALSRLIDYRSLKESDVTYLDLTNLIFALQSFAESITEREIRRMNHNMKKEILEDVERILSTIEQIEPRLSEPVQAFYLRPQKEIYRLMTRPTFMASLQMALDKLKIPLEEHRPMLKAINSARRQVVHSEGYDVGFLLSLLTDTATQINIGAKGDSQPIILQKNSQMHELYQLLHLMTLRYFEQL